MQHTTDTTHRLGEHGKRGQNTAHHGSHSPTGEPRTHVISRVQIQLTMEATHSLKSQEASAGPKCNSPHESHSPTGQPRTGVVSMIQMELTMEATHRLDSQGHHSEQGPNPAHDKNHSQTEEPRTHIIS